MQMMDCRVNYLDPLGIEVVPPSFSQVPLATYFHSVGSISFFAWPAQECVPVTLAQSFFPALAIPKHFSLAVSAAWAALIPAAHALARAAAINT
jgi:hypothetical protein